METGEAFHIYMYECKTLPQIYQLLTNATNSNEYSVLKDIAKMAYDMSKIVENEVTVDFVKDYLDNISEGWKKVINLSKQCARTSPTFSRSHYIWIGDLRKMKLHWDWEPAKQKDKLNILMKELEEIQQESYKYLALK